MTTHTPGRDLPLHDMVVQLVDEHTHDEPYIVRGASVGWVAHHRVRVPALIDQLLEPAPGGKGELGGSEAQARPAVRVEAHDTIELIAAEAGEWIDQLGGVIPTNVITPHAGLRQARLAVVRGSAAKRTLVVLRALHAGLSRDDRCGRDTGARITVQEDPEADSKDSLLGEAQDGLERLPSRREWCCRSHQIEADVRGWWRQARIISGWDSPTYRPFATCPVCSKRSGLRINLAAQTAVCVECRTVWEPATIGLLAEHVRLEREGVPEEDDELDAEPLDGLVETA